MTLEEAKALMNERSIKALQDMVSENILIDTSKKSACDILMNAFCRAVNENVIHKTSLNEYFVKVLNSTTNTLSETKLGDLLTCIHAKQPDMVCIFTLYTPDMTNVIEEWVFKTHTPTFNAMYEFVITHFNITPIMIRTELSKTLKTTIANNLAQFAFKYSQTDNHSDMRVSVTTITRLVNMMGHIITCEFKEV